MFTIELVKRSQRKPRPKFAPTTEKGDRCLALSHREFLQSHMCATLLALKFIAGFPSPESQRFPPSHSGSPRPSSESQRFPPTFPRLSAVPPDLSIAISGASFHRSSCCVPIAFHATLYQLNVRGHVLSLARFRAVGFSPALNPCGFVYFAVLVGIIPRHGNHRYLGRTMRKNSVTCSPGPIAGGTSPPKRAPALDAWLQSKENH